MAVAFVFDSICQNVGPLGVGSWFRILLHEVIFFGTVRLKAFVGANPIGIM